MEQVLRCRPVLFGEMLFCDSIVLECGRDIDGSIVDTKVLNFVEYERYNAAQPSRNSHLDIYSAVVSATRRNATHKGSGCVAVPAGTMSAHVHDCGWCQSLVRSCKEAVNSNCSS